VTDFPNPQFLMSSSLDPHMQGPPYDSTSILALVPMVLSAFAMWPHNFVPQKVPHTFETSAIRTSPRSFEYTSYMGCWKDLIPNQPISYILCFERQNFIQSSMQGAWQFQLSIIYKPVEVECSSWNSIF
jgi:hypothetical protein